MVAKFNFITYCALFEFVLIKNISDSVIFSEPSLHHEGPFSEDQLEEAPALLDFFGDLAK